MTTETKILKTLETIESHLEKLVDLALASGLASSVERTDARVDRVKSREERSEIKDAVEKH